uniref:AAA+ ATPase domain-containing protein n=1 Tax=Glycine max TaxID=3847 RepID=A0A0R0F8H1_SOYBN
MLSLMKLDSLFIPFQLPKWSLDSQLGESQENIRDLFSKAYRTAPSIIFIDEVDAIALKRENLSQMELLIGPMPLTPPLEDLEYLIILIGRPYESSREEILSVITCNVKLQGPTDLPKIAKSTKAFTGSDLKSLIEHAGKLAMRRITYPEDCFREPFLPEEVDKAAIKMSDLEGLGMDLTTRFLLYGPPGCGKTLIAKAVANAAVANPYVGVSEQKVRAMFNDAKACGWVTERLLNQLLIELDGADQQQQIGTSCSPDVIDPALLRPGRFSRLLYIPLPNPGQRVLILKALSRKYRVDASTDFSAIGRSEACENMSGADLDLLMEEAAMTFVKGNGASNDGIKPCHLEVALTRIFPCV